MRPAGAPTVRLFLGLWPTAEVRAMVEEQAGAWEWPAGVRRTPPERLHITLHFLGNVPQAQVPGLARGMGGVRWPGCELLLDRAHVWPGGIAVLEASQVAPELAELHRTMAERLRSLGLAVEDRRYRPHVTLARKASGARPPAGFAGLAWQAAPAFALVRSLPGGAGYETLQSFG